MTQPAKHTPGPWVLQPIRDGERVIRYSIWKEPNETPEDVIGSAYSLPNATMLAAAPAMYEAIRKVIEHRAKEYLDNTVEPYCSLVAALAQAEARS